MDKKEFKTQVLNLAKSSYDKPICLDNLSKHYDEFCRLQTEHERKLKIVETAEALVNESWYYERGFSQ